MLAEPGMEGLSWRERVTVKRAIARGRRLRDPRLVHGLAQLARWHRDRSLLASVRWMTLALPPALVVGVLLGPRVGADPLNVVLAVVLGATISELGINRRVRRRQARHALQRHGLDA
jgi:hypothetical protein